MTSLIITAPAIDDFEDIWTFIASGNPAAADRVENEMRAAMQKLCEMPGIGHQRADVSNKEYRFWNVYSYVIAYRVEGEKLYILRVIHGARNFRRFFPNTN